jgi:putative transcriptional regulator
MNKVLTHHRFMTGILLLLMVGLHGVWPDAAVSQETDAPARGIFLVASRQIKDPLFMESVVLLLNVDQSGAMGLIINKSSDRSLSGMFPEMRKADRGKDRLYFGGPVLPDQLLMLLRSKGMAKDSVLIINGVAVSTDRTVLLDALKKKRAGDEYRLYAGYAGWVTGQLEWEIKRGDWYLLPADAATVFHDDESKVWPALLRKGQEIMVQELDRNREAMPAIELYPPSYTGDMYAEMSCVGSMKNHNQ